MSVGQKFTVTEEPTFTVGDEKVNLNTAFTVAFGLKRPIAIGEIVTAIGDVDSDGDLPIRCADGNVESLSPSCLTEYTD